jgi:hypothetical protein
MPIFRSPAGLVFYAHVPKCAGSAVETHLAARFGPVAFQDTGHFARPAEQRWSKTSPQHIDAASLTRLFPPGFFAASFTIVRHPVSRLVSAYHFQRDVEGTIPAGRPFGDWLDDVPDILAEDPFAYDNHIRPMSDLVPREARVFHLEHGLDALVPWLDGVAGDRAGPRAIDHVNRQNEYARTKAARVTPTSGEIARIARIYARDFDRFGYRPEAREPAMPAPELDAETLRARDAARAAANAPLARFSRRLRARLGR